MPRRKISEYRSKFILYSLLNVPYTGWTVTKDIGVKGISGFDSYVVKVDQAVKGRFKKGLVSLDVSFEDIEKELRRMRKLGYDSFIVEPYITHDTSRERYFALTQDRAGTHISLSSHGGVDIEKHSDTIKSFLVTKSTNWTELASESGFPEATIRLIVEYFAENHLTLLEINPYISDEIGIKILDVAIEVDDTGRFFVDSWGDEDIRNPSVSRVYDQELAVRALDQESSASFNLSVLNPDGSVFLLLSGGGASVVIADEIHSLGYGTELANYGEYSGNPNTHETFLYTREILSLIIASKAKRKVLFIGGAVANFTDIASTFEGVIKAIDEVAPTLRKQGLKVYVRRGGPRQRIGLSKIEESLKKHDLFGGVYTPSVSISEAVKHTIEGLESK